MKKARILWMICLWMFTASLQLNAQQKKPNILVVFGDDVGYWNISAYNQGMMGYRTPNIDRIAHEGALFTDYYAQQSCTAGCAAFITGQSPIRTGLTKVGLPGANLGLQKEDPTLAELLKAQGYMTFQHGKNHLGDRNEFLPTVHGFDEFYGNLYHLNAEEEPENLDYPKTPEFGAKFGPRGVLKCKATATDNPAPADPRFGAWGKQPAKTQVRSRKSAWKPPTKSSLLRRSTRWIAPSRRASPSSFGTTPPACTSGRIFSRNTKT